MAQAAIMVSNGFLTAVLQTKSWFLGPLLVVPILKNISILGWGSCSGPPIYENYQKMVWYGGRK